MRGALVFAVVALATGCGAPREGASVADAAVRAGRVGASIARLPDGRVVVVNPDQGSVTAVDPASLEPLASVTVGGEPHALLPLGSRLYVTTYRGGEIVVVDSASFSVLARRSICAGPYGLAASPEGDALYVACEWEGVALRVHPISLVSTPLLSGLSRPRAIVATSAGVVVADFTGGRVHHVTPGGAHAILSLIPATAPYRPALSAMTANLATSFAPVAGGLLETHELVNHTGDAAGEPVSDDYGSVQDGNPKINPALTELVWQNGALVPRTDRPVSYASYDGGFRGFNGAEWVVPVGSDRGQSSG